MLQRYNIFLAQRAKLGKMKKEKILHPSVSAGFEDTARLGKRGQNDRMCRMTDVYFYTTLPLIVRQLGGVPRSGEGVKICFILAFCQKIIHAWKGLDKKT